MVAERLRVIDTEGIREAEVASTGAPNTAGTVGRLLQFSFSVQEEADEAAFARLRWTAFAEDWESAADADFDTILGDADLQ